MIINEVRRALSGLSSNLKSAAVPGIVASPVRTNSPLGCLPLISTSLASKSPPSIVETHLKFGTAHADRKMSASHIEGDGCGRALSRFRDCPDAGSRKGFMSRRSRCWFLVLAINVLSMSGCGGDPIAATTSPNSYRVVTVADLHFNPLYDLHPVSDAHGGRSQPMGRHL